MTKHITSASLTTVAERVEGGAVCLRLMLGALSLGETEVAAADWPADVLLQSRLLCRRLTGLKASNSLELLEAARSAVAEALAEGHEGARRQRVCKSRGGRRKATAVEAARPAPRRPELAELSGPMRQLLRRTDISRGELVLPDPRFMDDRLWVLLAEMRGLGVIGPDRRTLTEPGLGLAQRLQDEARREVERLEGGVPFARYQPGGGTVVSEWTVVAPEEGVAESRLTGVYPLYGDERLVAFGPAPSAARRDEPLADVAWRWERAVADAQCEVWPVAFSEAGRTLVWFSHGAAVAADLFDHVTRGRHDMTFTAAQGGGASVVNAYRCGARVAVMTVEEVGEVPEGVAELLEADGAGPRPGQRTLQFAGDLAFARRQVPVLVPAPGREQLRDACLALRQAAINEDLQGMFLALGVLSDKARQISLDWSLLEASAWGCFHSVRALMRLGADPVTARDEHGRSALMLAAAEGHYEVVCLIATHLVAAGQQVALNAQDGDGNTAAHWAAREGRVATAEYLHWMGAAVDVRNHLRRTPAEEAVERGNKSVAEVFRRAEPRVPGVTSGRIQQLFNERPVATLAAPAPASAASPGATAGAVLDETGGEERLAS